MSSTVLVAGGAGFIGTNLCKRLLREGSRVVCVDNMLTGRRANIESLFPDEAFTFIEHDIVRPLPDLPRVDRIYNLASPASPLAYKQYAIETLRANSEGTLHSLELAAQDGARCLLASTSEVYGDPMEHPQREDYRGNVSPNGPRSMYDEAKRYAEALTMAFASKGVDARVTRLFNTYGPYSDPRDGRMVPNFICQALSGQPLTVYGDGSQTRSLCYVDDTVAGLIAAMETPGARGETFNIGNPREETVLEYAETIKALIGSKSPIIYTEQAVGDDPQRRRPDITRATQRLRWSPQVSLEAGLAATVAYFEQELFGSPGVIGPQERSR